MIFPEQWLILGLIGLLGGLIGGALGVGGGALMVPALVMMSYPQKSAQGLSLAVMIPLAVVGAWRYRANPSIEIDLRVAVIMAVGALAGVLLGTAIAGALPGSALRKVFAVFLIGVAVRMLAMK